jgi:hypothetical protein
LLEIKKEQWKLEDGEIKIVRLNDYGNYERNTNKEEEIKDRLRRDIWNFERGITNNAVREFNDIIHYLQCYKLQTVKDTKDCPGCKKWVQHG